MGIYATADQLRAEPDVDDGLTDAAAERLIADAEDRIDELVVVAPVDTVTGRLLIPAQLEEWQRQKLTRATIKLAVVANRNPRAFDGVRFGAVSGPDFSRSSPVAGGIDPAARTARQAAASLLAAAGLRATGARATA